jgi:hypothetical protein
VESLATAALTIPERVALHCVHQHDAPFVDQGANAHLERLGASSRLFDPVWERGLRLRVADSVQKAVSRARPVRRVGFGRAAVSQIASNRRILGPDGKVQMVRYSATRDPAARDAPEGTIDPHLASVSFYDDSRCIARLWSYAVHPMSHYGQGRVSADFPGLARAQRDADEPHAAHLYFTGCAGNITAGKYNDGSPENRPVLAGRLHHAMTQADLSADQAAAPLRRFAWYSQSCPFLPREDLERSALEAAIRNPAASVADRHRAAMMLSWLDRLASQPPIRIQRLDLGIANLLFLPAETFVEYQLDAQALLAPRPLWTAAYGDDGPWYIPRRVSFDQGGYEPSVAFSSRLTELPYTQAIRRILLA